MLNELALKPVYSTERDDIANAFYVPVLSESVDYKRVSGYFSSAALSLFSKGIEKLVHNGGRYKLLISQEISENDYMMIKEGYFNREKTKVTATKSLSDYDSLSNIQRRDFSNLAYLIEINVVDIKVGFTKEGFFHSKYGIVSDKEGNKVYFSGSLNETKAAFTKNYEAITVIKSWTGTEELKTIDLEDKKFGNLWSGKNEDGMIFIKEFNEIIKSSIMGYSKGKIIMDTYLMNEDALILYYENKQFLIQDNLKSTRIDESKRQIKQLKSKYLTDEALWNFRDGLTYIDVLEIIRLLEKYGDKNDVKILVSESVTNFIEAERFMIEDISKRGLMIKNQDPSMQGAFNQFYEVLSREVSLNLRTIQVWVSFYMAVMRRVGNFSVPGAGKTAMTYGAFAYLSSQSVDEVDRLVVIGPKNSFKAWKDEFSFVFGNKRKLRVLDIHADNFRPEMLTKNIYNYNLLLFNYESLKKYEDELKKIVTPRTMLIFDEVHKIKGIHSMRAPIAIGLSQQAKYRYVLTGTPIPNGYQDTWNFLHIMFNNEYKSYFGFSESELTNINTKSVDDFNVKLFPFYWRVNKEELKVPKVNADKLHFSIATDSEQSVIDLLWRKYSHNPFVLYARLIQLSSNPSLLKKNIEKSYFIEDESDDESKRYSLTFEYNDLMKDIPSYTPDELSLIDNLTISSKFESAISKTDSMVQEGKTVLIWCIFVDTMHRVVKSLVDKGHRVALIYGKVPASDREEIITDFQNGKYDVLVTNPHTLAESVSLHKACHDAIYLEYSFNLTHMLQSRDRIHRLGLKDTDETNYYYYLLQGQDDRRNTIDQKIYEKLKLKEEIMIKAVEGTKIGVEFTLNEKQEILDLMSECL
ncbi:SNF2-related protein [Sporosarcina aquimarina]|uniref:SNF2-related protein n=1 Tax=Sporosarcina aquimarina TaxID=114975 RepID=UPI00203EB0D4|nr:SNF2-related protein [Sporosarcina aquimarina]MCM3758513.1 SNF2-related protein [Sporosarcina aquimarina]